jgi:hypothetical protein
MVKLYPLSDGAIVEFTAKCGLHFRLALCEHTVMGGKVIPNILYVTDDKKTYSKFVSGGMWVWKENNNMQVGVGLSDTYFFMEAEKMKFMMWL